MSDIKYGQGRNHYRDDRDVIVPARALPLANNPNVPRARQHLTGKILNQGLNDQCVSYACAQLFASDPIAQTVEGYTIDDLHRICQNTDEWRTIQPHHGTSARAAMKVYQRLGYIKNYWFVTTAEEVMRWILARSPVLAGFQWFEEMYLPESSCNVADGNHSNPSNDKLWIMPRGFPVSKSTGGHEVLLTGADRDIICPDNTKGAVEVTNSWGEEWGENGKAWLPMTSLAWLLANSGDALVPTEQLRADTHIYVEPYHPPFPQVREIHPNASQVFESEPSKIGFEVSGKLEITPGGNLTLISDNPSRQKLAETKMRQVWNGQSNVSVKVSK